MTWHPDMPPEYRNSILTGDARELAARLPDESVDLVFTDPVYDRIEDYVWLAGVACRALKPGAACLVWSNGRWHRINATWLEHAGLTYRRDFACVISTGPAPMNGQIIAKTNRLIWLDLRGGSKMRGYLADGYASRTWSCLRNEWAWTKNPMFSGQAIRAFTTSGAVVWDPFSGGGTTAAVCKSLGRNFVAFEVDSATADRARERLGNTPMPLFTLDDDQPPSQLSLPSEEPVSR